MINIEILEQLQPVINLGVLLMALLVFLIVRKWWRGNHD